MLAKRAVLKVWIEPGCIVCDACETNCPEVFHVEADGCTVLPAGQHAETLKRLTRQILLAAEECPVEVIRVETVDDPPE